MMFDPVVKAFIDVKEMLMLETAPIEEFDIDAEDTVIVDTTAETDTLPVSIE